MLGLDVQTQVPTFLPSRVRVSPARTTTSSGLGQSGEIYRTNSSIAADDVWSAAPITTVKATGISRVRSPPYPSPLRLDMCSRKPLHQLLVTTELHARHRRNTGRSDVAGQFKGWEDTDD